MKVGGTEVRDPKLFGLWSRGIGPIPGGATLLFEVELLNVS